MPSKGSASVGRRSVKAAPAPQQALTAKQIAAIHSGLKKAGLQNYSVSALHLAPMVGDAADGPTGPCYSQEINGHIVLICPPAS